VRDTVVEEVAVRERAAVWVAVNDTRAVRVGNDVIVGIAVTKLVRVPVAVFVADLELVAVRVGRIASTTRPRPVEPTCTMA